MGIGPNAPVAKTDLFPLEKILTITASDFIDSEGTSLQHSIHNKRELGDYVVRGVHLTSPIEYDDDLTAFRQRIPNCTMVVVDYKIQFHKDTENPGKRLYTAHGTALILTH